MRERVKLEQDRKVLRHIKFMEEHKLSAEDEAKVEAWKTEVNDKGSWKI